VELHPLHLEPFEDGTTDLAQELDLPLMAWSPLAGGRLFQDGGERAIRVRTALAEVAQRHGAEIDQVAFAFLLRHPARIHPITGTGNLERLARQAAAVDITLDREDWFTIWTASKGAPLP
jgi:predicted oxidoreductase